MTYKNPCIDPEFLTITHRPLPSGLVYTLFSEPNHDGYSFTHDPFTVTAKYPSIETICGPIEYTATFEGKAIEQNAAENFET